MQLWQMDIVGGVRLVSPVTGVLRALVRPATVPQATQPTYRFGVTVLLKLDVSPLYAQVALVDATWQDYPQWKSGEEQVVFRAGSLIDPDNPPYPGFAVATHPDIGPDGPRTVLVEIWTGSEPAGLRCFHQSVLHVGSHGVIVGSELAGTTAKLKLARGEYPLKILVNAETRSEVSRVVFALGEPTLARRADTADA